MDLRLKGKKAVILGGSRGIGRGIADILAAEGVDLALCARAPEPLAAAVAGLEQRGGRVFGDALDITDAAALRGWIARAAGQLGGIDILISNAGAMLYTNDEADWRANFDLDLLHGAVIAFDAARPHLLKSAEASGDAAFVLIGSVSASQTYNAESYGAIKAAQIHYAKGLAREYTSRHVRVNVVSPSGVLFEGGKWHQMQQQSPDQFAKVIERNPMGRMASLEDVGNAVAFLASPAASFITGVNLQVDGGLITRVSL